MKQQLTELFTPRINGKSFRCHCGANVFSKAVLPWKRREVFACNACHRWYEAS